MESRGDAYITIEEVKSNHNICNKSVFTIWLCKYFGPKFQIDLKLSTLEKSVVRCIFLILYLAIYSANLK
jgi:hypothetical protein